jgi:hypothetical protein
MSVLGLGFVFFACIWAQLLVVLCGFPCGSRLVQLVQIGFKEKGTIGITPHSHAQGAFNRRSLHCASLRFGMTIFLGNSHPLRKHELSSRPERSAVEGPALKLGAFKP